MNLEDLGWNPSLAESLSASAHPDAQPGRIMRVDGSRATALTAAGETFVELPSRLRRSNALVVGDWLALECLPGRAARALERLPRRTHLTRRAAGRRIRPQVLAANIDVVFIVSSMDADLSERRLERYLTVAHDGGAQPVILLTKAGLTPEPDAFIERARAVAPGVHVHGIDVLDGTGSEVPGSYLVRGVTAVLVGSSGVGKSTLLNHLAGVSRMATQAVRDSDGLGQHTTTHRELFVLPQGGIVIDTPGLRELAPWADAAGLGQAFNDIETLAAQCRFGDCAHAREPGCAVNEAVEAGELAADRLRSYLELRREIEQTEPQPSLHERRQHDRKLGRVYRQAKAHKKGRR
ncbi:MAG: ribosome small subunit-dependent GTPase A [Nannocystaceae bacterium]